jgi:hypothetical protein
MVKNNIIKLGAASAFAVATLMSLFALSISVNAQERVELEPEMVNLGFTSVCSTMPENTRKWRVQNTNSVPIEFSWEVVGTSQTGVLTAPAAGNGVIKFPGATDGANYTFFETTTVSGANTTIIRWNSGQQEMSTTKASGGAQCESFFEFDKVWTGESVDLTDVRVEFQADGGFSWTLGVDAPVSVDPGVTSLENVTEVITGLPENCTYSSDVPSSLTAPTSDYDDVTNVFTQTVTNTVSCETEDGGGEVLADTTTPQVTQKPTGAVDAGGRSSIALAGLVASVLALGAGLATRKFSTQR